MFPHKFLKNKESKNRKFGKKKNESEILFFYWDFFNVEMKCLENPLKGAKRHFLFFKA